MNDKTPPPILDVELHQLERSLELARQKDDSKGIILGLTNLGQAYLNTGDAPKGLTQFEEAIKLAEEIDATENQARLWGLKGMALNLIGNLDMAMAAFRKSNRFARDIKNDTLICDSLIRIGVLQADTGELTKAISKLEQAFAITVSQDDMLRRLHIDTILGGYFARLESTEKAFEYYSDGLQIARSTNDKLAACSFLINIGNIHLSEGDFEGAAGQYEEALDIASTLENVGAEISALEGLLNVNAGAGKSSLVTIYAEQLMRLAQEHQRPDVEIGAINALTAMYLESGAEKKAIPYLEKGLEIADQEQDGDWRLSFLMRIAFAYYSLEDLDKTQEYYQEAQDMALRLQDTAAEAQILGRLSAVHADKGELEEAIEIGQKALKQAHEVENVQLVGEQQILMALSHRDNGNVEKALKYCNDAIMTFTTINDEEKANIARQLVEELS